MQTIVESKGGSRSDLLGQVINGFAKMRVGYEEFKMTTILPALGEIKLIGEMDEAELRKVLRDITGEEVTVWLRR